MSLEHRLPGKCAKALIAAFDSLTGLLARCDPEAAATIVADLVKAQMNRPVPEPDPMAALNHIIDRAGREAETMHGEQEQAQPQERYTPPWLRPDPDDDAASHQASNEAGSGAHSAGSDSLPSQST
jgi:hypothetical protein